MVNRQVERIFHVPRPSGSETHVLNDESVEFMSVSYVVDIDVQTN